jgi:hypothetical protein
MDHLVDMGDITFIELEMGLQELAAESRHAQ